MAVADSSSELGDGVYYRRQDYASFLRRLIANLIDVVVVYFALAVLAVILDYLYYNVGMVSIGHGSVALLIFAMILLVFWGYLTICKASSLRTVGYRIAGLKIVTLTGKPVPWYQMTFRLALWICGPFSLMLDTLWVFTDDARQSCRDSYCGTLVVRNNAVPQGTAPIILTIYNVLGMTLMYKRAKTVMAKAA